MINPPIQMVPQSYVPAQGITNTNSINTPTPQLNEAQKTYYQEQGMAISYDIAAEYSAIGKINNIIADVAKELKTETDSGRKKLLEARISTLNNMVLQREARLNSMEQSLTTVEKYARA